MIKIPYFETSYFCFSNFSAYKLTFKGVTYPTSEHAYHAQKFEDESIIDEIKNANSPLDAIDVALKYKDKVKLNWNELKIDTMCEILREKVKQNHYVKDILLGTGNEEIIEDSPDNYFWGSGKDGSGQNNFGKVLMKIREELKSQ